MKNVNAKAVARKNVSITINWLIGFTEGDGSFSTNKIVPRFKLENHVKEVELYAVIKNFLGSGNLQLSPPRNNSGGTVILEVNNISILINNIISLFNSGYGFISKKGLDNYAWCVLVKIYYYGYHTFFFSKKRVPKVYLYSRKLNPVWTTLGCKLINLTLI